MSRFSEGVSYSILDAFSTCWHDEKTLNYKLKSILDLTELFGCFGQQF